MAAQFLAFIKPMVQSLGNAFNKIADSSAFVEAVNQWNDDKARDLGLKIIAESNSMNDKEKLEAIYELERFVNEQKKEAASEINEHQIKMAKIFIGILTAGLSVPFDILAKGTKKKNADIVSEDNELLMDNLDSEDDDLSK